MDRGAVCSGGYKLWNEMRASCDLLHIFHSINLSFVFTVDENESLILKMSQPMKMDHNFENKSKF